VASSAVFDDPEAGPTVLHFMVPLGTDGVRLTNTWRTLGMRATGSDDLVFDDVFVPDTALAARRPRGLWHPVMHLAWLIAQPLIYSVYLGVAEAARDIALGLVAPARRNDAFIQLAVGEMENALTAARLAVDRMVALGAEAMPGDETTNLLFAFRSLAGESSIRCVSLAVDLGGGKTF
jgi:alkylation response protein AidB-like acyl-CoA dehydrogenase